MLNPMFVEWMKEAEIRYSGALDAAERPDYKWARLQEVLKTRLNYEFRVIGCVSLIAAWAGEPCACESFKCEALP